jgi:hypothetical protein
LSSATAITIVALFVVLAGAGNAASQSAYAPRATAATAPTNTASDNEIAEPQASGVLRSSVGGAHVAFAVSARGASAPTNANHRSSADCLPPHTYTVARDGWVGVYSLARPSTRGIWGGAGAYVAPPVYACLLGRGATIALVKPSRVPPIELIGQVTLAGTIVAYTNTVAYVDTGRTRIAVLDISSGHLILSIPRVGGWGDGCILGFRAVTDLVVNEHGSVAWVVREGTQCHTTTFEVYSAHASGAPRLLDKNSAIGPRSLHLSSNTVSWETAGHRRSASLR